MHLENVLTSSLIPYEFNNRNHDDAQIQRIAKSIKEFGFNQPIIIDEKRVVLVGHGRLLAAKQLNLKEVPVIQLSKLTETQKKAYRILDNKLQNDSTWAFNNLELELGALEDEGFNLPEWGLDDLRTMFPEEEPEVTDDEFEPSEQEDIFIKKGDLIEMGKHRLLCNSFEEFKQASEIDFIFADPPYGINEQTDRAYASRNRITKGGKFDRIIGDDSKETAHKAFRHFESVPLQAWFGANHYAHTVPESAAWLVWDKRVEDKERDFNSDAELAYIKTDKKSVRIFRHKWKGLIKDSEQGQARVHPTQKPIALVGYCIKEYAADAKTVCDPFLGSGTTLIACDQLNRTCYGMEINPKYCQVIIERYKKHCEKSGKPFECKINGEPFNFPLIKENE